MIVYALLGTSRPLSVSTTTTIGILTGAQLAAIAPAGDPAALLAAATTLTVLVGIMLLAASCCASAPSPASSPSRCSRASRRASAWSSCWTSCPKLLGIHFDKGGFLQNIFVADRPPAGDLARDARRRRRHAGDPRRAGALRPARAGPACGDRRGHRRLGAPGPADLRRRDRRRDPARPARVHGAEPGAGRGALARRARHRADELHRDHRGGTGLRRDATSRVPTQTASCWRRAWATWSAACSDPCPAAAAPRRRR